MNNLQQIAALIHNCQDCPLGSTRITAVPGEGPENARIMMIAEGPGQNEDKQGKPFVGAAGTFLDQLLRSAGLDRRDIFITNMIKCRAPANRDPQPSEIQACSKYLDRQIEIINPDLIVPLGRYSTERFLPGEKVSKARGRLRRKHGRNILPMNQLQIHPAAGFRRNEMKDLIQKDFANLMNQLQMARHYPPDEEPDPPPVTSSKKKPALNNNPRSLGKPRCSNMNHVSTDLCNPPVLHRNHHRPPAVSYRLFRRTPRTIPIQRTKFFQFPLKRPWVLNHLNNSAVRRRHRRQPPYPKVNPNPPMR